MAPQSDEDKAADGLTEMTLTEEVSKPSARGSTDEKQCQPAAETEQHAAEFEEPPRNISGWKWYSTFVAILLSTFLYALDATVVADLQAVIVDDFGSVEKLPWLSVAFLLTATASNLVWGRYFGNFNAKWFYIFAVSIFEVGSIICAAAPSINVMILGRAIAGIGGSGLYVGCLTLIAATTTLAERPVYNSSTGLTWGLGIVLGPIIGGALSQSKVGWRWAFWINLFFFAACLPFYIFLIPSKDPRRGASFKARLSEMDYVGAIIQAGTLTCLVLAVNLGGTVYPWNSGPIIALFVVFGVLFILLGIQQVYKIFTTESRRLLPIQFFRSRTVLILFSTTAAGGTCAFIPIYMIPTLFQFTRGDTPLDAGVRLLPYIIILVVTVFINGAFMAKFGYYMPWYLAGAAIDVIGGALMFTVTRETSTANIYGYEVLLGIGCGAFLQASFSVAQGKVSAENIAPAIGFITLAQFIGTTLGLAIANSVLLTYSQTQIQDLLPDEPVAEIQAAITGARSSLVQNLSPELKNRVLDAIVGGVDRAFAPLIAAAALTVILSLFMRREKLFGVAAGVAAA